MQAASRAYAIEFGASMLAYCVILVAAVSLINAHPDASWRYLVALAPVVPVIFAVLAFVRFYGRLDELAQRIHIVALAFAFGVTGLATFTYGFLENVGLPHIPFVWIFPFMIAVWGCAVAVASRRYSG
jgi:hypothetical protein